MTFESRRKVLISQNRTRKWGDKVERRPYTIPINSPSSNGCVSPSHSTTSSHSNTPLTSISTGGSSSAGNLNATASDIEAMPENDRRAREENWCTNLGDGQSDIGASLFIDATTTCSGSGHSMTMTSTRGWSLDHLVKQSPKFLPVRRVSADTKNLATVMKAFEDKGEPLVIEGYQNHPKWPYGMFNVDYFTKNTASNEISVRNVHKWTDRTMKLSDFVDTCRSIGPYAGENEQERYYGKDSECPQPWENWLQTGGVIPSSLLGNGPDDLFRYRPQSASVQTLMCYIGIGDTFTPCHKDLCASSGQNLMCYTENNGSSFWFMTKGSDAAEAARYFQAIGQELDHENHVITLKELAEAPFKVYIVEQKLGDLVLVPPRSCHQVVNFGGITLKTSWSRMTLKGLSTAYHHELPIYRRACRPEIYRVKSTTHHALIAQTKQLVDLLNRNRSPSASSSDPFVEASTEDTVNTVKALLSLYDCILAEEDAPRKDKMLRVLSDLGDSNDDEHHLTCDFCGGDIFQSFFECHRCTEGGPSSGNRLHICAGCYTEGRSCKCSSMQPMQYRDFEDLRDIRSNAEKVVRLYEKRRDRTSLTASQELPLRNADVPPLFRAACYLNELRKSAKKDSKVCSISRGDEGPHDSPYHWVLSCKLCHSGKCFEHIMSDSHLHSVEALIIHRSDPGHSKYHKAHLNGKRKFEDDGPSLERDQKLGSRHPGYSVLVYNALNSVHCKPVSPRFMERGWYDKKYEISDEEELHPQASASVSSSEKMVLVQDVVHPQPSQQANDDKDQMVVDPVPTKRKSSFYVQVPPALYSIKGQMVVDPVPTKKKPSFYVQVPPAPYSTKRALSEYIGQSSVKMPVKETNPNPPKSSSSPSQSKSQDSPQEPVTEPAMTNPPVPSINASMLANGSRPSEHAVQENSELQAPIANPLIRVDVGSSSEEILISPPNNGAPKKKTPLSAFRFKKIERPHNYEGTSQAQVPSSTTTFPSSSSTTSSDGHPQALDNALSFTALPYSSTASSDARPPALENALSFTALLHSSTASSDARPPALENALSFTALLHSSTASSDAHPPALENALSLTALPHSPAASSDVHPLALENALSFTALPHSSTASSDAHPPALENALSLTALPHPSTASNDTPPVPQLQAPQLNLTNSLGEDVARHFASALMYQFGAMLTHNAAQPTQPQPPPQKPPPHPPMPMLYNVQRYPDTRYGSNLDHTSSSGPLFRQDEDWRGKDEALFRKRKRSQGSWNEGPNDIPTYLSQDHAPVHTKRRLNSQREPNFRPPPNYTSSYKKQPYHHHRRQHRRQYPPPDSIAQGSTWKDQMTDAQAPAHDSTDRRPTRRDLMAETQAPVHDSKPRHPAWLDQPPDAQVPVHDPKPRRKSRWDQRPPDSQVFVQNAKGSSRWDQFLHEGGPCSSSSGKEENREWMPSPHYSERSRSQPFANQRDKGAVHYPLPRPTRYTGGSRYHEVVSNTSYLYRRSRRNTEGVTQTKFTPHPPREARKESLGEPDSRDTDSTILDVSSAESSRVPPRRPTIDLAMLANHEPLPSPRTDSEMKTPTNELAIVSNDETFPLPRSDVGPGDDVEPRNDVGILRWTEEMAPVGNEETVAVETSNDSEVKSLTAEDQPHDVDEEWEDNYEQMDEPEPSPRRAFRRDANAASKDDDTVSLGPENDDLTTNHWV